MGWHGVLCCFVKSNGQADETECLSRVQFPPHYQEQVNIGNTLL